MPLKAFSRNLNWHFLKPQQTTIAKDRISTVLFSKNM